MRDAIEHIIEVFESSCDIALTPDDVKPSPVSDFGIPVAFRLAKKEGRNPLALADELASRIRADDVIARAESERGYVNISLKDSYLLGLLSDGAPISSGSGPKVVLEHTSVNPTGPVHVGRVRNTIIGDSIRRILSHTGYDVETHYYVNDIGRQVATIAQGIAEGIRPDESLRGKYSSHAGRSDYETFFAYVEANKRFESDDAFKKRVYSLIHAAENGDETALKNITKVARDCLEGQLKAFDRVGAVFDVFDYESEFITSGSVDEVLKRIRQDQHYVKSGIGEGLDLSDFGIDKRGGMTVCARADGTSVYLTRDIAYHLSKSRIGGRLINVLGEDHKLQFTELKTILEHAFGFSGHLEAVHFSFVDFGGVQFSTRRGDIATVDDLLDEAVSKAAAEIEKRGFGDQDMAEAIGVGAVKFHIVKTSPNKQISFSFDEALNFDGETGPYIQYAHARSCRILEKSGENIEGLNAACDLDMHPAERALLLKLLSFEDAVLESASQLRPDIIATYLLDLTGQYGRFYMGCPVIDSQGGIRARRLLIVKAVRDRIRAGLELIGIKAPERM
jgi:arginyl-tRNA synthetase